MNDTNDIAWRRPSAIPQQQGYRLTVKTHEGDLINTSVQRNRLTGALYMPEVDATDIKGWIPNEP